MLTTQEIADRRIIDRIELANGKGQLVCGGGRIFALAYDSLPDLIHAVEMVNLKLTGKMLSLKVVPKLHNQGALVGARIVGGGADLYPGSDPHQRFGHWCRVEINGNVYDNWFTRLDELIKCLYRVVKDEQKDAYVRPIMEGATA